MKTLLLLLVLGGILAHGLNSGRIQLNTPRILDQAIKLITGETRESLWKEINYKQMELDGIRTILRDAQKNAPYCNGRQMNVTVNPKAMERIARLEEEIRDLRTALAKIPHK